MKPYFKTALGTLYHGDCFGIVPQIGPVDAVVTDPPYAARTHGMAKTNKGRGHGNKLVSFSAFSGELFVNFCDMLLAASAGWVVMTCDHHHAPLMFDRQEFVRIGAWLKTNPMPQISADRPGQGHEAVLILHSGKTKKAWNRGGGSAVWRHNVCQGALVPTQKPLPLVRALVSDFTHAGDLVLDPCAGSGSTALACEQLGRRWVAVEANEAHCEAAAKRLAQPVQMSMMQIAEAANDPAR